jgi:cytochrome b6-f complex iron-sulfur subunit
MVEAQGAAPAAGAAAATGAAPAAGTPGKKGGGSPVNVATSPVTVGEATKYAKDGIYDEYAKTSGFIVVAEKGKIYAVTAVCSHKRGLLVKDPAVAGQIKCTKHDGKFSAAGSPISGPPKTSLARLAISKNAKGELVVDPTKQFQQADWEKAEAFVKSA